MTPVRTARPPVRCNSAICSPVKLRGPQNRKTIARSRASSVCGSRRIRRVATRSRNTSPTPKPCNAATTAGPDMRITDIAARPAPELTANMVSHRRLSFTCVGSRNNVSAQKISRRRTPIYPSVLAKARLTLRRRLACSAGDRNSTVPGHCLNALSQYPAWNMRFLPSGIEGAAIRIDCAAEAEAACPRRCDEDRPKRDRARAEGVTGPRFLHSKRAAQGPRQSSVDDQRPDAP